MSFRTQGVRTSYSLPSEEPPSSSILPVLNLTCTATLLSCRVRLLRWTRSRPSPFTSSVFYLSSQISYRTNFQSNNDQKLKIVIKDNYPKSFVSLPTESQFTLGMFNRWVTRLGENWADHLLQKTRHFSVPVTSVPRFQWVILGRYLITNRKCWLLDRNQPC